MRSVFLKNYRGVICPGYFSQVNSSHSPCTFSCSWTVLELASLVYFLFEKRKNFENTMSVCFICDSLLDDGTTTSNVKIKGIKSFIEASQKRKDGKGNFLKEKKSITVHLKCQKTYVNEKLIAAHVNKTEKQRANSSQQLQSLVPEFNFKTHCFLCGIQINEEYFAAQYKTKANDRDRVYSVRQIGVRDTIPKAAGARNDDYGRSIIQRIESVIDLPAADAQYHNICLKELYKRPTV